MAKQIKSANGFARSLRHHGYHVEKVDGNTFAITNALNFIDTWNELCCLYIDNNRLSSLHLRQNAYKTNYHYVLIFELY